MKKPALILGSFFGILFFSACKESTSKIMQTKESYTTLDFELTSQNNIALPATINGDSLSMMFHTAVNDLSVTEEAKESLFEKKEGVSTDVNTWGGESESDYFENNTFQIGPFTFDSMTVWTGMLSGPSTDGKFGPFIFDQKLVAIDYDQKQIKVYDNWPKNVALTDYHALDLRVDRGMWFVKGNLMIGEEKLEREFLVHTGYGGSILLDDEFVQLNDLGSKLKTISESELKDSFGNVLKTKKSVLPAFQLGEHQFVNGPVSFFEGAIGRQQMSVMGNEFLRRFNIIFDYQKEKMYIRPNDNFMEDFVLE